jgi:hypothetical protein
MVLKTPATMSLYMELPSIKNETGLGYNESNTVLDDINQY